MDNDRLDESGIYAMRNLVSGRIYVGSAIKLRSRRKSHFSLLRNGIHHSVTMQRSWDKHGENAFSFEVLEYVPDVACLIEREQYWIDKLHAADPKLGFNMSPTAGSCLGVLHTAETKAKLSAQRIGIPKSEAHRLAIGAAQIGKIISETQKAIASVNTRRHFEEHPEARERMREVGRRNGLLSKGRVLSAEVRQHMSEVRKGSEHFAVSSRANLQKITPEGRKRGAKKTADALRGRPRAELRNFSFAEAEEIRRLKALGLTYDQLESLINSDRATLFRIVKNQSYVRPSDADSADETTCRPFSWQTETTADDIARMLLPKPKPDCRTFGPAKGSAVTEEVMAEAKRLYEVVGLSQCAIAARLGIGQSSVSRIILGRARKAPPDGFDRVREPELTLLLKSEAA